MNKRRGVSPVIATVLLVGIVVVLGVIIFLWFNSLKGEAITKFDGQNVELICKDVSLEVRYQSPNLYVSNTGQVPVFRLKIKTRTSDGDYSTKDLGEQIWNSDWPTFGLNPGGIYSEEVDFSSYGSVMVIPVLRGETKKGQKSYECPESSGYNLI